MFRAYECDAPADDDPAPATQLTQSLGGSQHTPLPDEAPGVVAQLIAMDSDLRSLDLSLDKPVTFGRAPRCVVQLDDPTVSGMHCRVYYDDHDPQGPIVHDPTSPPWTPGKGVSKRGATFLCTSNFWVEDSSSNGTYVNNVRMQRGHRVRLCHHDVIALCNPESKRGSKGTKFTYLFSMTNVARLQLSEYPNELVLRYDIRDQLGTGAFSEVRMAVERNTGNLRAVKILDKFKYTGGTAAGDSLAREVDILKRLSHPNIIAVHDVIDTERMLFIVLELARGGDLFDHIAKKRLTEDEARDVFSQILLAVQYLHARNICHRDLKPENVLLEREGGRIKLTDFGFSRVVGEADMMKTLCGTPMYVAPEVLALSMGVRDPSFEPAHGYGKAVDMWSLGVILYILLCGEPPWPDANFSNLYETVLRGAFQFRSPVWTRVSPSAKDLVNRLLTVAPSHRMAVDDALEHEWITGIALSPPRALVSPAFAVPSALKRERAEPEADVDAGADSDPGEDANVVRRLLLKRSKAGSDLTPNLRGLSDSPRLVGSTEATPLLPASAGGVRLAFADENSPTVRKLGFETPEKRRPE